jgi:hypothetical protein
MTAIPPPPPLSPTEKTPAWEDLLDILYAPARVFERRRAEPKFLVPFLVVTVVVAAVLLAGKGLLQTAFDADFARGIAAAMKANPQLTPDQMEKGRGIAQTFTTVFLLVGAPLAMLLLGIIIWLCGKAVGAKEDIASAYMIGAYAYVPRIIAAILLVLQPLILSQDAVTGFASLSVGPARFFNPDTTSKVAMLYLTRLDLFTIWSTLVIAVGLQVTGKVSAGKAWLAAAIVWFIPSLLGLLGALRG